MLRICQLLVAIIVLLVLVRGTHAEVHWLADLEAAKKQATATNRLVLVHFWAPWCKPCWKVEKDVFQQPGLGEELAKHFVPVKLHFDHHRSVARSYGIEKIPSDVIINPKGELLFRTASPPSPEMYLSRMQQVAFKSQGIQNAYAHLGPNQNIQYDRQPNAGTGFQPDPNRVGGPAAWNNNGRNQFPPWGGNASLPAPPVSYPGPQMNRPVWQMPNDRPVVPNGGSLPIRDNRPPLQPLSSSSASETFRPQKTEQAPPVAGPRWGLDGYCPVSLVRINQWKLGDRRWGVIHENKIYLFSGPAEQREFLHNPIRYSPVLSGNDPVLLFEQQRQVEGRREFGVYYGNKIYLFATEATLNRFEQTPVLYAQKVQTMAPRNIKRR